jgi:hypothetical protein
VICIDQLADHYVANERLVYLTQGDAVSARVVERHTSWRLVMEWGDKPDSRRARVEWFAKTGWVEVASAEWSDTPSQEDCMRLLRLAIQVVQPRADTGKICLGSPLPGVVPLGDDDEAEQRVH